MKLLTKLFISCAALGSLMAVPAVSAADLGARNMGKEIASMYLAAADQTVKSEAVLKAAAKDIVLKARQHGCQSQLDRLAFTHDGLFYVRHQATERLSKPSCLIGCHLPSSMDLTSCSFEKLAFRRRLER